MNSSLINYVLFALFIFKANCSMSELKSSSFDDLKNCVSTDLTCTTVESTDSIKELVNEPLSNSYESLMERLNLRKLDWSRSASIDYKKTAQPGIMAEIVLYNFVEGNFHGQHRSLKRNGKYGVNVKYRFNHKILYHLMHDQEVVQLIGFDNCLWIINNAMKYFKPDIDSNIYLFYNRFKSVVVDLVDFLDFILKELAPRYPLNRSDSDYDLEAHCNLEYVAMVDTYRTINLLVVNLFKQTDFLKVIVRRYYTIWPASMTQEILNEAHNFSLGQENPHLFRDIFGFLIRIVPEYFIHPDNMSNYNTDINHFKHNIIKIMEFMAPIFRALMLIDRDEVIDNYLEGYYLELCGDRDEGEPCFSSFDNTLKVLDFFIRDSKFALIKDENMKERKKNLLEKILIKFYKLPKNNFYSVARYSLIHHYLPLYEVLLQHFSEQFNIRQKRELLEELITTKNSDFVALSASISMGYLEFDNFDDILNELQPQFKTSGASFSNKKSEKIIRKQKAKREIYRIIEEIHQLIQKCPIKENNAIFVAEEFKAVPWPCPKTVQLNYNENDPEFIPKLLFYAQAVLRKRFDIPIFGGSFFESTMNESATWSEMIGYCNLMIETKAKLVYGVEEAKTFKFIDTTKY